MSTILTRGEQTAPTGSAPRMLTLTADLLPPEITEARRSRQVHLLVIATVAGVAVAVAAGYVAATVRTSEARSTVSAAQDQTQRLTRQQNRYAEVVNVQAQSQAIRAQLASLLAEDLEWSKLLASLQAAAPAGVRVTSVAGSVTPESGPGSRPATVPPTAAGGAKVIGTLTVGGAGTSNAALAAYLDALGKVPGLANPLLASANVQQGTHQFSMQLDITDAALGGRFTTQSRGTK